MQLKPYPEYKDSCVEWIGEMPSNWDLVRNKNIFSKSKNIVGAKWKKYPVLSLTKKGVIIKDIERNEGKMPSDFSIYQIVKPHNLLMCLFDIDVTPRCVGYINNKGIVSAAYSEIAPITDIYTKYYYYWYLMLDFDKQLLHLSKNLRNSLSNEDFMALPIVKPSLEEQEQIASFLDKKTSEIDLTIEKDTRLIELLLEKRTSLINHVVTKGLDPEAPMKDSGVEWIGEIPEGWDVTRLKFIAKLFGRIGFRGYNVSDLVLEGEGALTIGGKHISKSNKLNLTDPEYLSWDKYFESPEIMVRTGDIIITQRGTLGKAVLIENDIGPATINPSMILIKDINIFNKYLYCFLISDFSKRSVELFTSQTAVPMISQEQAGNFIILKPSLEEQEKIAGFLDIEFLKIEKIIQKVRTNITLLQEYKKSLIHHVVTGKVDVRDVA